MNIHVHHEMSTAAIHERLGDLVGHASTNGFRPVGNWPGEPPQVGRLSPAPAIEQLLAQADQDGVYTFVRLSAAPEIAAATAAIPNAAVERALVKAAERTVRDALGGHYGAIVLTHAWDQPEVVAVIVARDEHGHPVRPFSRETVARLEQAWDRHALEAFGLERRAPLDQRGLDLEQAWRASRRHLDRGLLDFLASGIDNAELERRQEAAIAARDELDRHVVESQFLAAGARRIEQPTFAVTLPRAAAYFGYDSERGPGVTREAVERLLSGSAPDARVRVTTVADAYHIVIATDRSYVSASDLRASLLERLPGSIAERAREAGIATSGRDQDLVPAGVPQPRDYTRPLIDIDQQARRELAAHDYDLDLTAPEIDFETTDPSHSGGSGGPAPALVAAPDDRRPPGGGHLSVTIDIPDAGELTFVGLDEGQRDQIIRNAIRQASPASEGLDYAIDSTPPGISVKILVPLRAAHEADLIRDAFTAALGDGLEQAHDTTSHSLAAAGPESPLGPLAEGLDRAQYAMGQVQTIYGLAKFSAHDPGRAAMHMTMQALAVAGSIAPPPVRLGIGLGRQVFSMAEGMVRGE